jgi:hypothetical protein
MAKPIKIYVAGKMSKHSHFRTHFWRDEFLGEINRLTGLSFISFDPIRTIKDYTDPELVFGSDVHMISQVDVLVAYLSEDFSVGGSQEILIAKYFNKPVIALAPRGSSFNRQSKEVTGQIIKNFRHPFVYSTCDVVCEDVEEVAKVLQNMRKLKPKSLTLIEKAQLRFEKAHSKKPLYELHSIG